MQGDFHKLVTDVVLSDDDDDDSARMPRQTAPIDRAISAADDTEDDGTASAEASVPSSTGAGAPGPSMPTIVDRASITQASRARGRKRLHPASKRFDPSHCADQVMT
jgi:hypothetical protein